MYICIYIYIYTYLYVCVYIFIYTHTHVFICIFMYSHFVFLLYFAWALHFALLINLGCIVFCITHSSHIAALMRSSNFKKRIIHLECAHKCKLDRLWEISVLLLSRALYHIYTPTYKQVLVHSAASRIGPFRYWSIQLNGPIVYWSIHVLVHSSPRDNVVVTTTWRCRWSRGDDSYVT